jgi:hypothetical protein
MAAIAPSRPLPPVGATLLCLESGSTSAYPITVERHVGRYFIAGAHRFHVYDDWKVGTIRHTWRKPAAMVWMPSPEEQAAGLRCPASPDPSPLLEPPCGPCRHPRAHRGLVITPYSPEPCSSSARPARCIPVVPVFVSRSPSGGRSAGSGPTARSWP